MARPIKEIDKKQFEKLCEMQCTEEEICGFFEITDKTLTKWCKKTYKLSFSEIFKQKRGAGKVSLRRTQWQMAKKSVPMAIWLGKQYLGQKEFVEEENKNAHVTIVNNIPKAPVVLGNNEEYYEKLFIDEENNKL